MYCITVSVQWSLLGFGTDALEFRNSRLETSVAEISGFAGWS